jgi:RHS repeat-associated protein
MITEPGWLGLPAQEKVSQNSVDVNISTFNQGDLTLSATTYFATTYNRQSVTNWDDGNSCFLTTTYQYDNFGNCVAETMPGDRTIRYVFETTYHTYIEQSISPENAEGTTLVTYAGYDPRFDLRVAEQDENGFIFVSALDGFGRLIAKQGPVPVATRSDPNLLTPCVSGSMRDSFMAATVVSLETVSYRHDGKQGIYSQREVLQEFPTRNARSVVCSLCFVDGLSRERVTVLNTGNTGATQYSATTVDYTADGKPSRKGVPFFCPDPSSATPPFYTSYQYDALGRPVLEEQPGGAEGTQPLITRWIYGKSGVVKIIQAAGAPEPYVQTYTHHWFDGKDCIIETAPAADGGAVTRFQFDPMGRNWQSVDPNNISNTLTYDSLNRKTSLDNPDQNTTDVSPGIRYRYDATTGLLSSQTDAAQAIIDYRYDKLGRVLTTVFQDGRTFTYRYDTSPNGRGRIAVITITKGDNVESMRNFSYDEYGNTVEESLTIIGEPQAFITWSRYDPVKRLVEQTLPDQSSLRRTFTKGLLSKQSLDDVEVTYSAFTPAGNYTAIDYNNGMAVDYRRSPVDQIYTEFLNVDDQRLFASHYQYDQLNQVLTIEEHQGGTNSTHSFVYKGKRLVSATIPGFETTKYQYDAGGNLRAKNASSYSYDAHFPCKIESSSSVVYQATRDACGRTLSRTSGGQTVGFQYDGLGCLHMVKDPNDNILIQCMSDDGGRRLRHVSSDGAITLTINANYQLVKTPTATIIRKTLLDATGALASIVTQAGVRQRFYFRRDRKGSVTHCFDTGSALQCQLTYDAFGQVKLVSGSVPDIPLYESRSWDRATGLYYFGARYYDPSIGTFLTPDTRLGGTSELQCNVWNRFAFELNNPLNHVDPDGHASWWIGLVIGVAAVVGGIVIVATAGAATGGVAVALGALGGALIGGGITAVEYSARSQNEFSWRDFGIQVGISAGIHAAAGGLLAGVSGSSMGILERLAAGAFIGAAGGAATNLLTATAEGQAVNSSEVGISALVGLGFGAMGGAGVGGRVGGGIRRFLTDRVRTISQLTDQRAYVVGSRINQWANVTLRRGHQVGIQISQLPQRQNHLSDVTELQWTRNPLNENQSTGNA